MRIATEPMKTHVTTLLISLGLASCLGACSKEPRPQEESSSPVDAAPNAPLDLAAPPDLAAPQADAKQTPSGIPFRVLQRATSTERPREYDRVTVSYSAWTSDGKLLDSSEKKGRPVSLIPYRIIPAWGEALQLMAVGEKRRFWVPAELSLTGIPGASTGELVFDVEVVGNKRRPDPPTRPSPLVTPPPRAQKKPSGLAYLTISKGTGKRRPKAGQRLEIHYTAWAPDGRLLDSTLPRGRTLRLTQGRGMPGLVEGLPLMTEGETAQFWMPAELTVDPKRGKSQGPAVVEVTLVGIQD